MLLVVKKMSCTSMRERKNLLLVSMSHQICSAKRSSDVLKKRMAVSIMPGFSIPAGWIIISRDYPCSWLHP